MAISAFLGSDGTFICEAPATNVAVDAVVTADGDITKIVVVNGAIRGTGGTGPAGIDIDVSSDPGATGTATMEILLQGNAVATDDVTIDITLDDASGSGNTHDIRVIEMGNTVGSSTLTITDSSGGGTTTADADVILTNNFSTGGAAALTLDGSGGGAGSFEATVNSNMPGNTITNPGAAFTIGGATATDFA